MPVEILKPIVALAGWTMVMWGWKYATRLPAIARAKIDTHGWVGGTGKDLDRTLPASTQWKAHNYNHLMEQPTVFYAVALVLAISGAGDGMNAGLAWLYVCLRVVHSLVQATINKVVIRFAIFSLSSLCLVVLVIRAAMAVFG
jgi:hypothetical protein